MNNYVTYLVLMNIELKFRSYLLLRNTLIQVVAFLFIFNAISLLRETEMLSSGANVVPEKQQLKTLANNDITLSTNGKRTIVYFFAPWCQICHFSIENLQKLYRNNPQVNVIAVALDYVDTQEVLAFTKKHQLTFPIALGNEQVKAEFKVVGYPSYYVLNGQNTIIARSLGYSTEIGLYLRTL